MTLYIVRQIFPVVLTSSAFFLACYGLSLVGLGSVLNRVQSQGLTLVNRSIHYWVQAGTDPKIRGRTGLCVFSPIYGPRF